MRRSLLSASMCLPGSMVDPHHGQPVSWCGEPWPPPPRLERLSRTQSLAWPKVLGVTRPPTRRPNRKGTTPQRAWSSRRSTSQAQMAGRGGGVGPCVGAVGLALGGGVPCPGLGEGVLLVGFDDGPVGGEPAEDVAIGDPFGGGELLVFVAADRSVEAADDELFEFGSDVAGEGVCNTVWSAMTQGQSPVLTWCLLFLAKLWTFWNL